MKVYYRTIWSRNFIRTFFLVMVSLGMLLAVLFSQAGAVTGPPVTGLDSPSHPDENAWYALDGPSFEWSSYGLAAVAAYNTSGNAFGVALMNAGNQYAAISDGTLGLLLVDVTDPANPVKTAALDTVNGSGDGLVVSGGRAYMADGLPGLQIINVSDPSNPVLLGSYNPFGPVRGVEVRDGYAYIAAAYDGLQIINVSDPAHPSLVGALASSGGSDPGLAVTVSGDHAYLADGDSGVRIINISNPASPSLAATIDTPSSSRDVAVAGDLLYIADGYTGLMVYDITDPANPSQLGTANTAAYSRGIEMVGSTAYVADDTAGLYVIDVSDPSNPAIAGNYNTPGNAYAVSVKDGIAYVADKASGLQILRAQGVAYSYCIENSSAAACQYSGDPDDVPEGTEGAAYFNYVGDGDWLFKVKARDSLGNWGPVSERSFKIDNADPEITEIQPSGVVGTDTAVVSAYFMDALSGIDADSATLAVDGNNASDCIKTEGSISCTVAGLAVGAHEVSASVADKVGNSTSGSGSFSVGDATPPVISNIQPSGNVETSSAVVSAYFNDPGISTGINSSSASLAVYGATVSDCVKTDESITCNATGLEFGYQHVHVSVSDNSGNIGSGSGGFNVIDTAPPVISQIEPSGDVYTESAAVRAYFSDPAPSSGINPDSASLAVYGGTVSGCAKTATGISCTVSNLTIGAHEIQASVADNSGNATTAQYSFNRPNSVNYYWTWYDSMYMRNWVLMANPAGSGQNLEFDLTIGAKKMGLGNLGAGPGVVPQGMALTPIYPGMMGGPVAAISKNGTKAIVSQRSLMGNSLEEVLATESDKMSNNFFWTWYDMKSAGFQNWVLVSNMGMDTVRAEIRIGGELMTDSATGHQYFDINPGTNVTPNFPGKMGGPVELRTYVKDGDWNNLGDRRNVIASQRVTSNFGQAFNEVPGIPASELQTDYMWTWYDMKSSGYSNWVLIANPGGATVRAEIRIAGQLMTNSATGSQYFDIAPGQNVTPTFPGVMNGPVQVTATAPVIASQRVLGGPSFEEVPGYPTSALSDDYHWTWYDMVSAGSANWILIANPGDTAVTVDIKIAGVSQPCAICTIPAHGRITPTFPGVMNGPVEVIATGPVMVSQRVTWQGHFNEVLGSVLD